MIRKIMSRDIKYKQNKPQKLLIIVGPTASGKSDLAVFLARKYNGEVISADSRQVYTGLDIGTGKIPRREMRGVRHHLLDVARPQKRFSAEQYRHLARKAVADIVTREKIPVVCGGTGFYIEALLNDNAVSDVPPDERLREKLSRKTLGQLLSILKKVDRMRWQNIAENPSDNKNARRIIRAIEIAEGKKVKGKEALLTSAQKPAIHDKYTPFFMGIKIERDDLKKRIRTRLEKRLKQGMISEVRRLHAPLVGKGLSWRRMEELGLEYRYVARYLQGEMEKTEMIDKLNTEIWHYARRQMSWWKRNKKIRWFKPSEKQKITKSVKKFLSQ